MLGVKVGEASLGQFGICRAQIDHKVVPLKSALTHLTQGEARNAQLLRLEARTPEVAHTEIDLLELVGLVARQLELERCEFALGELVQSEADLT